MAEITTAAEGYDSPDLPYTNATTIIAIAEAAGAVLATPIAADAADPVVQARVDWGRWLGDCSSWDAAKGWTCANAQLVDPADTRFFCVACGNAAVAGRWRVITWPADRTGVEAPLEPLLRPEQNWTP